MPGLTVEELFALASLLQDVTEALTDHHNRLRKLEAQVEGVLWICYYCGTPIETPTVLWPTVRYRLVCHACCCTQDYLNWIKPNFDPNPAGKGDPQ